MKQVFIRSALAWCGLACVVALAGCDKLTPSVVRPQMPVAMLEFSSSSSTVSESTGFAAIEIRLSLPQGGMLASEVTCDVADMRMGTATSGADYLFSAARIVFPAGSRNGDSRNADIAVLADAGTEPDETLSLSLSSITGARPGTILSHTLTITNVSSLPMSPSISFATPASACGESWGLAVVDVRLSMPPGQVLANDVTFDVLDEGTGTATASSDYYFDATRALGLGFSAGAAGGELTQVALWPLSDAVVDGGETVILGLRNVSGINAGAHITHTLRLDEQDIVAPGEGVIYVLDRSQAMQSVYSAGGGGAPPPCGTPPPPSNPCYYWDVAAAVFQYDIQLPENLNANFALVTYGANPEIEAYPASAPNTPLSREDARQALDAVNPGGDAPLYSALREACTRYGTNISRIILISGSAPSADSGVPTGLATAEAILRDLPTWFAPLAAKGCVFECRHVLKYRDHFTPEAAGNVPAGMFLRQLAASAGGSYALHQPYHDPP